MVFVIGAPTCLPDSLLDRSFIVLIGILSFGGQVALVVLTKFESASTTALLRKSFDVILAFAFQLIFFGVSSINCIKPCIGLSFRFCISPEVEFHSAKHPN